MPSSSAPGQRRSEHGDRDEAERDEELRGSDPVGRLEARVVEQREGRVVRHDLEVAGLRDGARIGDHEREPRERADADRDRGRARACRAARRAPARAAGTPRPTAWPRSRGRGRGRARSGGSPPRPRAPQQIERERERVVEVSVPGELAPRGKQHDAAEQDGAGAVGAQRARRRRRGPRSPRRRAGSTRPPPRRSRSTARAGSAAGRRSSVSGPVTMSGLWANSPSPPPDGNSRVETPKSERAASAKKSQSPCPWPIARSASSSAHPVRMRKRCRHAAAVEPRRDPERAVARRGTGAGRPEGLVTRPVWRPGGRAGDAFADGNTRRTRQ